MGDELDVKIITRSGKTHMLTITKEEMLARMLDFVEEVKAANK